MAGAAPGRVVRATRRFATSGHADPQRPAKLAPTIPAGRAGRPEEIAGAVAWFFSGDAGYASGAVLRVAGGR